MLTRRDIIKTGLAGGAGLLAGRHARAYNSSPSVTPFQVPLPIPEVLTPSPSVTVTMKTTQLQILPAPNPKTTVWSYFSPTELATGVKTGNSYLGPIIKVKSKQTIYVTQVNNLSVATTVHLHGGHTPAVDDGSPLGPSTVILPGASRLYTYPNNQIAANLWYHDHIMDFTGLNVYMGLAGFYMLQDDVELNLNLPSGNYDIPLVIQDRQFNGDGSLFYPQPLSDQVIRDGFLGDTILVNGAIQPYFQVANRKYRFRLLNGSNARHYKLSLSTGSSKYSSSGVNFTQIGTDGGLLPAPVTVSSIALAPAERVEIVIDFSKFAVGTKLTLKNSEGSGSTGDIMRFDIVRQESDPSSLPATLRPFAVIDPKTASVTRNIDLDFDRSANEWVLNGLPFDPNRVDFRPKLGATEIWQFNNHSGMLHPMHIHDIMFQVLSGGTRYSYGGTTISGWKDTVPVDSWGSAQVIMTFADNTGNYVYHCHKLEHEDHAMMGQFQVG